MLPNLATTETRKPSRPLGWDQYDVTYVTNPDQSTLRALALAHGSTLLESAHGSINKLSKNKSRKPEYTYIIAPDQDREKYSGAVISRERAALLIAAQRRYIEHDAKSLIEVQGYLGVGEMAVSVQWLYTLDAAHIAAMQQCLTFPRSRVERESTTFAPSFRIVYTPEFKAVGFPGQQALIVDLDRSVTYLMGADFFGESKKGALRMLNDLIFARGGLVMHAGAKEVRFGGERCTVVVMGLSGTGKTTLTLSHQGDLTRPIQDDMITLMPGGRVGATENGYFVKTSGLTLENEPAIHRGVCTAAKWVENVYQNADGTFDFLKEDLAPEDVKRYRDLLVATGADAKNVDDYAAGRVSLRQAFDAGGAFRDGWEFIRWSQNGRAVIPNVAIENTASLDDIAPLRSVGILNRDEGPDAAIPAIVRFTSPEQASGYFMLGETSKTAATGKDRGRLRCPFTQPFFPRALGLQADRFRELAKTGGALTLWMMNTGYVGGGVADVETGRAHKVRVKHSSTLLEFLLRDRITWKADPTFGYLVVDVAAEANRPLLELVPAEVLNPVLLYERQGRLEQYAAWAKGLQEERRKFLEGHGVHPSIVAATITC